jgi:SulP family sulfate permease
VGKAKDSTQAGLGHAAPASTQANETVGVPPERRPSIAYQTTPPKDNVLFNAYVATTPGLQTLQHYRRHWLRPDIFAGIAVVAYLVPQVMAYCAIVNVPPVVGLWTALPALIVYAVMGKSRMLSVGPESTVALMAGTAIAPLAAGNQDKAVQLAAALSLIVALWCFVARIFRLGVIAELLSQPLLVGYLAGGAVLMIVGQLGKVTGTKVHGESIVEQVRSFLEVVKDTHLTTLIVGASTLALLVLIHLVKHRWPAPLIAVAAATIASSFMDLQAQGVKVVGEVPQGLPGITFPAVSWHEIQSLLVAGIGVAIVAYGDNTLIARGFPAPADPDEDPSVNAVDAQQELVALGGVHVAVGMMGGYPVSSSASRTALALAAGARTQMYSLVAAVAIVIVLFVAGPLVRNLPQASLGAVVFYAASKLVSWKEMRRLARFRRRELMLAAAGCIGTILFGILAGVGIAIALSVLEMSQRLARPHDGVLGRIPGLAGMHDVSDYPNAETLPGLIVYRYDAPLFFANAAELQRRALTVVEQENAAFPDTPARWFLLNVEANVEIDITAADGLRQLHKDLAARGVRLGLARVKNDLRVALDKAGLLEVIGTEMLFPTLPVAEEAYIQWASLNPYAAPVAEAPPEEEPAAPVWGGPQNPETLSVPEFVPAAVQAAQLEEAGTEARLNAPGSDIPPDPGAIGPDSGDGGEPTTKNPFTTTFWKQNPLGLGGHGDHGHHGNHDGAADHEASAPTTTADGDRAADATPASNGTVPASVDAGVSDDALALNDPDAAEAQSDESDSEADEDRDKTAPNGKGARGKKRAKSS